MKSSNKYIFSERSLNTVSTNVNKLSFYLQVDNKSYCKSLDLGQNHEPQCLKTILPKCKQKTEDLTI